MSKPTIIVSDIHLGAVPASVERAFIGFLRALPGRAEHLLINGDLFDFWFEYRSVVPSQHFDVLRALADLRESGVRLTLVGGNHDAWGGEFLERTIGMHLADGISQLEISGRSALVAHGDGLAHGDIGYKILRKCLRSRPARRMIRAIHPDLAHRIVRLVSRTEPREEGDKARVLERARVLRDYARKLLDERGEVDLVIFGHCHEPEVLDVGGGRYYLNSGDWVDHRTYTLITQDQLQQREWRPDSSERDLEPDAI